MSWKMISIISLNLYSNKTHKPTFGGNGINSGYLSPPARDNYRLRLRCSCMKSNLSIRKWYPKPTRLLVCELFYALGKLNQFKLRKENKDFMRRWVDIYIYIHIYILKDSEVKNEMKVIGLWKCSVVSLTKVSHSSSKKKKKKVKN
jgi:hypothetical protein